jgi:tRNA(Ile)-lysidine synthase
MFSRFSQFIAENKLVKHDDSVLLAVSGGIDSMVMAHLFLQLGNKIGIAHCNFSLRAEESDKDELMVRDFAAKNNIPFHSIKFETKKYSSDNGISIQMAARELRYSWFEETRKNNGYDSIAVAHNLNDNVETILINITRGTGIAGLTGMETLNNNIIRPLLFASRRDIELYCNKNDIIYREDSSNSETKYTRNKIRHIVIPVLKEINPSLETTFTDMSVVFTEVENIVSDYISGIRQSIIIQNNFILSYSVVKLKHYLNNNTILYELFKPYNLNNQQLDDLKKIITGKTGGKIITSTHRIIKNRNEIIISSEKHDSGILYSINNIDDLKTVPLISSVTVVQTDRNFIIPTDSTSACLDYDKISYPLVVRRWNTGDFFYPLGMKNKKKLSNYFIDKKYSLLNKEDAVIIESDGKIVWIVGDRIDNRFRITDKTKNAIIIKSVSKD